jgi:hypothetical protein
LPAVLLVVHEEKDERDLLPIAVVKPARGTAIRFLGSASARPLRVVRLRFALPDGIIYIDGLLCLLYANHQSDDKTQR